MNRSKDVRFSSAHWLNVTNGLFYMMPGFEASRLRSRTLKFKSWYHLNGLELRDAVRVGGRLKGVDDGETTCS